VCGRADVGGPCSRANVRPFGAEIHHRPHTIAHADGPFAASKELVGSFFIIEATDMDDAVRVASLHPAAQLGEDEKHGFALASAERKAALLGRYWAESPRLIETSVVLERSSSADP
jgi:YCII-related domain